jgi:hypothetical protein
VTIYAYLVYLHLEVRVVLTRPKMPDEQNPSSSTPTVLWSFLRRRDAPPLQIPSTDTSLAPLAPIDRTGTSMRMVLLDTQANLEKFGDHVSKLVSVVEETKGKIDLTSRLWEVERERLGEEMVNLGTYIAFSSFLAFRWISILQKSTDASRLSKAA